MQFTIRNITDDLKAAAKERAAAERKSLNAVLVEALQRGLGVESQPTKKRDISHLAGRKLMDADTLAVLDEFRQIDPDMWK